jgi:hypothetical protein
MQWRLEVERVGPRLRTNLAADQRDWRQHLETAHASTQALGSSWPEAKAVLTKLGAEVGRCVLCAASWHVGGTIRIATDRKHPSIHCMSGHQRLVSKGNLCTKCLSGACLQDNSHCAIPLPCRKV